LRSNGNPRNACACRIRPRLDDAHRPQGKRVVKVCGRTPTPRSRGFNLSRLQRPTSASLHPPHVGLIIPRDSINRPEINPACTTTYHRSVAGFFRSSAPHRGGMSFASLDA
jgi:hypothetical protein